MMENEFREMKRKEEKQMADKMFEKNKMTKEVNDLKRAIINLEKQNIDLENLISECAGDQTNNDALVAKTKSDLENLENRLKQKEDEAKATSSNRNEA